MKTSKVLTEMIPENHVMLLFWVRTPSDSRDTAGSTGHRIIPAKGCLEAAKELDCYGDQEASIPAGHGVTVLWPSGYSREVRGN